MCVQESEMGGGESRRERDESEKECKRERGGGNEDECVREGREDECKRKE